MKTQDNYALTNLYNQKIWWGFIVKLLEHYCGGVYSHSNEQSLGIAVIAHGSFAYFEFIVCLLFLYTHTYIHAIGNFKTQAISNVISSIILCAIFHYAAVYIKSAQLLSKWLGKRYSQRWSCWRLWRATKKYSVVKPESSHTILSQYHHFNHCSCGMWNNTIICHYCSRNYYYWGVHFLWICYLLTSLGLVIVDACDCACPYMYCVQMCLFHGTKFAVYHSTVKTVKMGSLENFLL